MTTKLRVNETFYSLQGEGTLAGMPCAFVRLTGCPLRCKYCDSTYAFDEGEWMTLDEIVERVRSFGCKTVEVTGGEPLMQADVYPLMARLCDEFETVLLETCGALNIDDVDQRVRRIVDFKCPSSGESQRNDWSNAALLRPTDEVKFVVCDRADYEWAREKISEHDLTARCPVIFSPVAGAINRAGFPPEALAEWILSDGLNVRLGLQLHKIIWGDVRGR